MKPILSRLRVLALALGSFAITMAGASAAPDNIYNQNDLLLFFQNPTGSAGTDQVVVYSLGSTYDVFRRAATPGDPTYGTTISLGNINTVLNSTYSTDWTSASTTLFAGAVGQNGNVNGLSNSTENEDYARTVYVSKPRLGAGSLGESNSASVLLPQGATSQGALASNILGSSNAATAAGQPGVMQINDTIIDNQNTFFNGNPATAYGFIQGGVMGSLSSTTYSLGSVDNIVLGLDIYRATPVLNASGWQNINGISGVTARNGYYLGTVTLSSNGDVNFVAVPEPSTLALLGLGGLALYAVSRRRKNS
ncbi:MAG: hypothetical protein Fur0032_13220 [Terrimicrobiaceae bacterium]